MQNNQKSLINSISTFFKTAVTAPPVVLGATRKTHVKHETDKQSEIGRFSGTVREETLFAQKNLLGTGWNLFQRTDRPMLPVGHEMETKKFLWGLVTQKTNKTFDPRKGIPKKIASGLSTSEMFQRMAEHETGEGPRALTMTNKSGSRTLPVQGEIEITRHTNRRNYWRNIPNTEPETSDLAIT